MFSVIVVVLGVSVAGSCGFVFELFCYDCLISLLYVVCLFVC